MLGLLALVGGALVSMAEESEIDPEAKPITAATHSGALQTGLQVKTFTDAKGTHRYGLFLPANYDPTKKWPVILFLHGAGERGNDGQKMLQVGLGPALRQREKQFPFIAVLPQCEDRRIAPPIAWYAMTPDGQRAKAILEEVERTYSTDKNRVYLTGISMGGFGAWQLAHAEPERFAAIVPICGGGDPKWAPKIASIPCWCFHGKVDPIVTVRRSRGMIEALEQAGGKPRYTEYEAVGHNCWDAAYGTDELFVWLLSQQRRPTSETASSR